MYLFIDVNHSKTSGQSNGPFTVKPIMFEFEIVLDFVTYSFDVLFSPVKYSEIYIFVILGDFRYPLNIWAETLFGPNQTYKNLTFSELGQTR